MNLLDRMSEIITAIQATDFDSPKSRQSLYDRMRDRHSALELRFFSEVYLNIPQKIHSWTRGHDTTLRRTWQDMTTEAESLIARIRALEGGHIEQPVIELEDGSKIPNPSFNDVIDWQTNKRIDELYNLPLAILRERAANAMERNAKDRDTVRMIKEQGAKRDTQHEETLAEIQALNDAPTPDEVFIKKGENPKKNATDARRFIERVTFKVWRHIESENCERGTGARAALGIVLDRPLEDVDYLKPTIIKARYYAKKHGLYKQAARNSMATEVRKLHGKQSDHNESESAASGMARPPTRPQLVAKSRAEEKEKEKRDSPYRKCRSGKKEPKK